MPLKWKENREVSLIFCKQNLINVALPLNWNPGTRITFPWTVRLFLLAKVVPNGARLCNDTPASNCNKARHHSLPRWGHIRISFLVVLISVPSWNDLSLWTVQCMCTRLEIILTKTPPYAHCASIFNNKSQLLSEWHYMTYHYGNKALRLRLRLNR